MTASTAISQEHSDDAGLEPTARAAVADRLVAQHAPGDPTWTRTIESWVDEDAERFAGARIRAFVPILVETRVRRRLQGTAPGLRG